MKKVLRFPWYVLLISIYPALYYWANNVSEFGRWQGFRLVSFAFLAGIFTWGICLLIFRNLAKASLIACFFLIWFWTFGHLQNILSGIEPRIAQSLVLLPLWIGLLIVGIRWIHKHSTSEPRISYILSSVTVFLVLFQLIEIVPAVLEQINRDRDNIASISDIQERKVDSRPDIYYIILDTYTSAHVLSKYFNYDNSDFISKLESLGFLVADCSQSNYSHTHLSLSSSLNYRTLEELFPIDPDATEYPILINESAVQRILERWGYKTVAFETGHLLSELRDADIYFSRRMRILDLSEFDLSFLDTSFLRAFMREPFLRADLLMADQYRTRVLFVLDRLAETPKIEGPKFVFAHILVPHPPFVFGPNGEHIFQEFLSEAEKKDMGLYKKGFLDQSIYINKRIVEIVQRILSESSTPPIVIIQGDHGPFIASKEAVTGILNAYYLPGFSQELSKSISPVNTFRLIFNSYFGQDLKMLEDVARWSNSTRPLRFEVIPNNCDPDQASKEK